MSSRVKHAVEATVNKTSIYTAKVALDGVTGSLVNSTDMGTTVEGTSGGLVTVTLSPDNRYKQVLHWEVQGQTNAAYAGIYRLEKVAESGEDGTFQFKVLSGSVPVDSGTNGAVGLTGSLFAVVRDTDRTV